MTKDEIKKVLREYHSAKWNYYYLNTELTQINRAIEEVSYIRAVNIATVPSVGMISDPAFSIVQKKIDLDEKRRDRFIGMLKVSQHIIDTAEVMLADLINYDNLVYRIFNEKYVLNKSWGAVYRAVNYSKSQVHRWHGRGIKYLVEKDETK